MGKCGFAGWEHGGFHLLFLLLSADYSSLVTPSQTHGGCPSGTFLTLSAEAKKYQWRAQARVAHG
jgi:hypothetical protein